MLLLVKPCVVTLRIRIVGGLKIVPLLFIGRAQTGSWSGSGNSLFCMPSDLLLLCSVVDLWRAGGRWLREWRLADRHWGQARPIHSIQLKAKYQNCCVKCVRIFTLGHNLFTDPAVAQDWASSERLLEDEFENYYENTFDTFWNCRDLEDITKLPIMSDLFEKRRYQIKLRLLFVSGSTQRYRIHVNFELGIYCLGERKRCD